MEWGSLPMWFYVLCVWSSTNLSDGSGALQLRPPASRHLLDFLQRLTMLPQQQVEHRCHGNAAVNRELVRGRKLEKKCKSEKYVFFDKNKKILKM